MVSTFEVNNKFATVEILVYADKIIKKNRFGMKQDRTIAVTDEAIYNFKGKNLQRKILLTDVAGISKTVAPSKDQKLFAIHHSSAHDY